MEAKRFMAEEATGVSNASKQKKQRTRASLLTKLLIVTLLLGIGWQTPAHLALLKIQPVMWSVFTQMVFSAAVSGWGSGITLKFRGIPPTIS